jgi:hypothetical protein
MREDGGREDGGTMRETTMRDDNARDDNARDDNEMKVPLVLVKYWQCMVNFEIFDALIPCDHTDEEGDERRWRNGSWEPVARTKRRRLPGNLSGRLRLNSQSGIPARRLGRCGLKGISTTPFNNASAVACNKLDPFLEVIKASQI